MLRLHRNFLVCIVINLIFILFCHRSMANNSEDVGKLLSKTYNLSVQETNIIMFTANSEKAAKLCNFNLTENFYLVKNSIMKNNKYRNPYNMLLEVPFYDNLDVNSYCNQWYEIAGPRTGSKAFYR